MWKIRKYFAPYWLSLVAVIALLFIQAMTNLQLPDLMANIVDNGIQSKGIVGSQLEIMPIDVYEDLQLFMNADEQKQFSSSYVLVKDTDSSYTKLQSDFSGLQTTSLYSQKNLTSKEWDSLEPIVARALISYMLFTSNPNNATFGNIEQIQKFQASLPAGVTMIEALRQMPKAQLETILSTLNAQFDQMQDMELIQAGALEIQNIYTSMGVNLGDYELRYIGNVGWEMVFITAIGAIATILVGLLAAQIAAGLSKDLRKDLFVKITSFSNKEFDEYSTASLITRSSNDITQIQLALVRSIRFVFYAPILGIGAIYKVWSTDPNMVWIVFAALGCMAVLMVFLFIVALPKFKKVQFLLDRLNLVTRESLTGMLVIRAFTNEKVEEGRFDRASIDVKNLNLFVNRLLALMQPFLMFIMNGAVLLIIWFGAKQIDLGTLQVGNMMAFMQYAIQVILAFLFIAIVFITLPRATVSAHRIYEVLQTPPSIKEPKHPKKDENPRGVVQFHDVCFAYPNAQECVLEHISFTAEPGKTTAFIGSTGSGKSTLINLVPRLYDVTNGSITIDGIDVRDFMLEDLHNQIGYVPQKGYLFAGTIKTNLEFGRDDLTREDLDEISTIAQAKDFIYEKPNVYDEPIAQSGSSVSGGQRQRLSIARALAKQAKVLIFDDSFSALDFKTDKELRQALHEKVSDATILLVAQRVASILSADQIIVLEAGKIVGSGTHDELMKTCPTYIEIASSQLSKEELSHVG